LDVFAINTHQLHARKHLNCTTLKPEGGAVNIFNINKPFDEISGCSIIGEVDGFLYPITGSWMIVNTLFR